MFFPLWDRWWKACGSCNTWGGFACAESVHLSHYRDILIVAMQLWCGNYPKEQSEIEPCRMSHQGKPMNLSDFFWLSRMSLSRNTNETQAMLFWWEWQWYHLTAMDMGWLERDRPGKFDQKSSPTFDLSRPRVKQRLSILQILGGASRFRGLPWHTIAQHIPIGKCPLASLTILEGILLPDCNLDQPIPTPYP